MDEETKNLKALQDIEDYGCHILHVMEDEIGPRFTYSIGIEKTSKQPELIITGLKQELAYLIINDYNSRIRDGYIFETEKMYTPTTELTFIYSEVRI